MILRGQVRRRPGYGMLFVALALALALAGVRQGTVRAADTTVVSASAETAQADPNFVVNTLDNVKDDVCGTEHCSLRDAIVAANATATSSTITFSVAGTITLATADNGNNGLPLIATPITINGTGITISGNNAVRVFFVSASGELELNQLTITNGLGDTWDGGGGIVNAGTLRIKRSTVTSNDSAGSDGGGIRNAGTLTIDQSTIANNIGPFGAGIFNTTGATATITNSTISGNTGTNTGAGIRNRGTLTIVNSTISGNVGAGDGGGIASADGSVALSFVTIANNRADSDGNSSGTGGGIYQSAGSFVVRNSIIIGNFVGSGTSPQDCSGSHTTSGVIFVGSDASDRGCNGAGGLRLTNGDTPSGAINITLANNGGPTQTHLLPVNSSALNQINAATCTTISGATVTTDQRGQVRPQTAGTNCDVGAVEGTEAVQSGLTLVVNVTNDNNGVCTTTDCSLREAITLANSTTSTDETITFNIPGTGVQTITLTSALPTITDTTTIDGTTQSGASGGCAAISATGPLIELNGASANGNGLTISAPGSTMRGLIINRFSGVGIYLDPAASGTTIECNYLGTNAAGTAASANARGMFIASTGNTIGGAATSSRNVISGNTGEGIGLFVTATSNVVRNNYLGTNAAGTAALGNGSTGISTRGDDTDILDNVVSGNTGSGVELISDSNTVQGNRVGTNAAGTAALPNARGININGNSAINSGLTAGSNLIGGTGAGQGNLVSGNSQQGILLQGSLATGNIIQGNIIGLAQDGTTVLGNGTVGIYLTAQSDTTGPSNNTIGFDGNGTPSQEGNRIHANGTFGIQINGAGIGNRISGNSISGNGGLGINLGTDGVTANDTGDPDTGPNNLQNFPVIVSAIPTAVLATLNSTANTDFAVEVFSNTSCDTTGGNGEGASHLGYAGFATDASGNFAFTFIPATPLSVGQVITATATSAAGTSEFSACFTVTAASTTFVVNSAGNGADQSTSDGLCFTGALTAAGVPECTLRAAIQQANATAVDETITFSIPGTGVQTISPTVPLPTITGTITIDGTTQSGTASGCAAISGTGPLIELNGTNAGASADGLNIAAPGSTVRGLTINRFGDVGIELTTTASGTTIECNYLGTNATGTAAAANARGMFIASTGNTIGGAATSSRNVVSGNTNEGVGLVATATGNVVQNNYLGTNAAGTAALGNGTVGLSVFGDDTDILNNVISGNTGSGLQIVSDSNTVQGNRIGTNALGTAALPNARGININGNSAGDGAASNLIGGTGVGQGNLISGNSQQGILLQGSLATGNIIQGNIVGLAQDGATALANGTVGIYLAALTDTGGPSNNTIGYDGSGTVSQEANSIHANGTHGIQLDGAGTGNRLSGNSISGNGGLGINLGTDTVTANDTGDPDTGENNRQNFPVLNGISATGVVGGSLDSLATNTAYPVRIEFFANTACDSSGYGEGEEYLGATSIATPGAFSYALTLVSGKNVITATAIDNNGNTSEFSACKTVDVTIPSVTLTTAAPNPTNVSPIPVTVQFSETVFDFVADDLAIGNGTVNNFMAVDGDTYTFDLVPAGQGQVTVNLPAGRAQDAGGNDNTAAAQFSIVYDSVAPTVTINQASTQADPTSSSPITFTVVFNGPVTGFGNVPADVILSGTAGATTAVVTQIAPNDGTTYAVAVSGMTSSGTVIATIPAGAAQDLATNPSAASTSTDNTVAFQAATQLDEVSGTMTYGDPTATLTARLRSSGGTPLAGQRIVFTVGGQAVCGGGTGRACPVTDEDGVATLTGAPVARRNVGNYANLVCANFAGNATYVGTGPVCGSLQVQRRILWLKPQDRTVGLRQPNPATTPPANCAVGATGPAACWLELANGSSFANGESWASLNLANVRFAYNRSGNGPATERVGAQYRITVAGALSQNYDLRYQTGTLTVVQP